MATLKGGCEISLTNGERIDSLETVEVEVIDEQTLAEMVQNSLEVREIAVAEQPGTSSDISPPNKRARRSLTPCLPKPKPAPKIPKMDLSQAFHWTEDYSYAMVPVFPEPNYGDCFDLKPHEQFEKFFDMEVLQHICDCSNLYGTQKNTKMDQIKVDGAYKWSFIPTFISHIFIALFCFDLVWSRASDCYWHTTCWWLHRNIHLP